MGAHALFRCDASPDLGAGHLMRCLSFAETLAWAGWSCSFATNREARATVRALATSGFDVQPDCDADTVPAINDKTAMIVVDHYKLGATFERRLAGDGRTLVIFDDLADRPHACDVLVDPTPGRAEADYRERVPASTRLLLGARFAILRREWRDARKEARDRLQLGLPIQRILVSMGATDPADATSRVLAALDVAKLRVHVDVVLSSAAPHRERVAARMGANMMLHVDPTALPMLAAKADLAIGTPGTSSFERAVLGLPAVMIPVADNQRFIAEAFASAGAADVLPQDILDAPDALAGRISALAGDSQRRAAMSRAAASFTDGRGAARLLVATAGSVASKVGAEIRLRLAEAKDEGWLLELQQQPATRRYARDPRAPDAAGHARWFVRMLSDDDRLLMIVEVDGAPAGMVRLDRMAGSSVAFEVSIAIDQGRYGERIAIGALGLIRRLAPGADLIATVFPENRASLALFAAAGYRPDGENLYRIRAA